MRKRVTIAVLLALLGLGAAGCAPAYRCEVLPLPICASDGTRTTWTLQSCTYGRLRVTVKGDCR